MKRYVKEFASDMIRIGHLSDFKIKRIKRAVECYEQNLLTAREAITAIVETLEK